MEDITLRDFFAGMALSALVTRHEGPLTSFSALSRQSFLIADQMLKAREHSFSKPKELDELTRA